jgi:hypothetical protein
MRPGWFLWETKVQSLPEQPSYYSLSLSIGAVQSIYTVDGSWDILVACTVFGRADFVFS